MPCLVERALELLGGLARPAGHDAVEELDDHHLRAEPAPHRAQLEADRAGADDQEPPARCERQRLGRADDALAVVRRGRGAARPRCRWR